jgi:lipopolysaccharide biosynthesis regulator YciM
MPTESAFVLAALFVLMAGIGWAFRHFADRDRGSQAPARISADYIRGLNLVLNRQTDEALELFVQMAKVDDETLETHFALGHLFRRRGEVDRAIRVHQNLLARPNLSESQRHQALFSLGEDYLSAGLFDRAEKLFSELTDSQSHAQAALRKLVYIYEQEREWNLAIETHRKLEVIKGEKSSQITHYYCELAEQARLSGDLDRAKAHLKNTVRSESGALRGNIIRAAIALEEGNYPQALGLYTRVINSDQRFIPEVLPAIYKAYRESGEPQEFDRFIDGLLEQDPEIAKGIAYAAIIGELNESQAMRNCVERFVTENPVLAELVNLSELNALDDSNKRAAIDRIAHGLQKLALSSARYRCTNCGYSTRRFIWHCPSCKEWEVVRPVQAFQLEALVH